MVINRAWLILKPTSLYLNKFTLEKCIQIKSPLRDWFRIVPIFISFHPLFLDWHVWKIVHKYSPFDAEQASFFILLSISKHLSMMHCSHFVKYHITALTCLQPETFSIFNAEWMPTGQMGAVPLQCCRVSTLIEFHMSKLQIYITISTMISVPRMFCNGNGAISHLQTKMGFVEDFRYSS